MRKLTRAFVAVVAAAATGLAGLAVATEAVADVPPVVAGQVNGNIYGPTGAPLSQLMLGFCANDCLHGGSSAALAFPSSGAFSVDVTSAAHPYASFAPGSYKIAVDYLDLETLATLGVDPTFVPGGGYLQRTSTGTYLVTENYAAATSFTISDTGTSLELKLAPFVGARSRTTYTWSSAGKYGVTCPNYTVRVTLPQFQAGTTMKVTAYSQSSTSSTATKSAFWSRSYTLTGSSPVVAFKPTSATAGRYVSLGLVVSKPGYNTWSGITKTYKVTTGVCATPSSMVKSWSTKSGTVRVGRTVSVSATKLTQSGPKVTYTWKVGRKTVKAASTTRKLKLSSKWRGKKLTVVVKVTARGNTAISKTISFGTIR